MLKVKNIFGPTIQGEGAQTGLAAIFIRFSGCNIWDGRESTRASSACPYCDTDFRGGDIQSVPEVVSRVLKIRGLSKQVLIVLTGGEPLLQPEDDLIQLCLSLRKHGCLMQIETNGSRWYPKLMSTLDFITVSPKVQFEQLAPKLDWNMVDCLKILNPHPSLDLTPFMGLPEFYPMTYCIQPIQEFNAGQKLWDTNIKKSVELVKHLGYPWRLSLQTHKILGEE